MTVLDNEETIYNSALAFLTASQLKDIDLTGVFELIEDVVAQADETSTSMFYDTLETTSTVISGIFAMATAMGEAPSITPEQATKFGNYLISNTFTMNTTSLGHLLTAANALNSNAYVVPCSLVLASSGYVSRANPNIQVRLSTILGSSPPTEFSVTLQTVTDPDGQETSPKKKLKAEKGLYSHPLFQDITSPGVYTLTFSSEATGESPVVELSEAQVQVTVSFEVTVGSADMSVVDREHSTTAKTISLEYPNSSKDTLEADQHSKVVMTFSLLNKETRKSVVVHQAFVRLSLGVHEIFFVAMADKKTHRYKFELDMVTNAEDFAEQSGSYSIALIVGDFALENPFSWDVGTVNLVFPGATVESAHEDYTYKPKPEIQHMFRPDEKHPPKIISSTFTVLVLSPLAILLVLWVAVGVNVSGFGVGGVWALIFHLGLAGIFVVYYFFWLQLNMFDTLKLLTVLSIPTFLAGNRMLKQIAGANKQSP
jgi:oligosaccharyltransferase complex subunit delta (ribophorin II)